MSMVSASEINETINTTDDVLSLNEIDLDLICEVELPDVPDLEVNDTVYVESSNIDDFFVDGALQSKYANKTLIFSGKFENFGKFVVDEDNVNLVGTGAEFKNVVFDITGDNVTLNDFSMDLDSQFKDNDGAAIQVSSDNVNLINLNINYVVPTNVEAYGIYGVANRENPLRNLRIFNSTINFEGHNDNANTYNCGMKLTYCEYCLIENNTIITSLPLRDVNFGAHGATLDSDYVMSVGMEGCNNFKFIGNTIVSEVNKRPGSQYPTLDCILISQSDNSLMANNSVYMTDFITKPGLENYLYGIDVYCLNNLTITKNDVSIVTTGGKLAAGTAYPIQVSGPIDLVNITDNDLYSFSNGPNIGVYSQNYYGATALSITNNRINVTGLAGVHEWALVAGIESQDSNSVIHSNIIEVHSVGEVNINDNIYGVSYRQSTAGNHSFNIQNNTVFSDGFYSVSLLDSADSTVANNLLISYHENATNDNGGFNYGDMSRHKGIQFYNNQRIKYDDYFASINNIVDGGEEYDYVNPVNSKGLDNQIDGSSIQAKDTKKSYSFNPLIPGSSKTDGKDPSGKPQTDTDEVHSDDNTNPGGTGDGDGEGGTGITIGDGEGDGDNTGLSLSDLLSSFINSNTDNGKQNTTSYDGKNANTPSNDTEATPSTEGTDSPASESKSTESIASASSAGSSGKTSVSKAYELEDLTKNIPFIPSVAVVLIILFLLLVGYKRKNSKFN